MLEMVKVFVTQSCLTLCDPMDCSQLGSSVNGIFQARILEWVAIPFFPTQGLNVSLCLSHQGSPNPLMAPRVASLDSFKECLGVFPGLICKN